MKQIFFSKFMEVANTLTFQPTLVLKKIMPSKIFQEYKEGKFSKTTFPEKKVKIEEVFVPDFVKGKEMFRDKNNCIQTVHFAGKTSPMKRPCFWCLDTCENPVGIPVGMFYSEDKSVITFVTQGAACSYECCGAYIRSKIDMYPSRRDSTLLNSLIYLGVMFSLSYPNEEMPNHAPDFRLLTLNGGTLTPSEYHNGKKHSYLAVPSMITCSGSSAYLKLC
jgi:hypothetical protein